MGDQCLHCIPFGWQRRLYLPEPLGVQFSETFIHVDLEEFARTATAVACPAPFAPLYAGADHADGDDRRA